MKKHTLFSIILMTGVAVGLVLPVAASEIQPMDTLKGRIDKGLALLNDAPCRTPACRIRQERRLWQLLHESFDFFTMSRLVLASRWYDFTPEQQMTFVREFAEFLRRSYLPELLEKYNGEQVEYVRQEQVSSTRARVDVVVLWRARRIPITAKMIRRDGTWKIYDVSSLGISAMQNYRAQFRWLLQQATPAQVIEILKSTQGRAFAG
ncbi:MAG: ABC transporter substrate-binding protein [Deltaproteobacteria bacterium]|nr:ABC transporter substrate-binding protein [Deltaproteobacteria bacterium]